MKFTAYRSAYMRITALIGVVVLMIAFVLVGALTAHAGPTSVKAFGYKDQAVDQPQSWWDALYANGYRLAIIDLDNVIQQHNADGSSNCTPPPGVQERLDRAKAAKLLVGGLVHHVACWGQSTDTTKGGIDASQLQFAGVLETGGSDGSSPADATPIKNLAARTKGGQPTVFSSKATWPTSSPNWASLGIQNIEVDPVLTYDPLNFTANYMSPAAHAYGGWTATDSNTYRVGVRQEQAVTVNGSAIDTYSFDPNFLDPVAAGTVYTTPPSSPSPTATATATATATPTVTETATPLPVVSPTSTSTATATPTSTATATPTPTPTASGRSYPLHTNIVSTTFWVGEIFNASISDGSQVCSTYDSKWAMHHTGINKWPSQDTGCNGSPVGGCDGPSSGTTYSTFKCTTESRDASNNYFPKTQPAPLENPFYLDLPYDDLNDSTAFAERCSVIPWANDPGYSGHCSDTSFSYMKNRWVRITGPNGNTCYGQIEDAGPSSGSAYHDKNYVFGSTDARPLNKQFSGDPTQGAGADVSPALNGCLGFAALDGDNDHISWSFVDSIDVPAGPWKITVTTSGVTP